MTGEPTGVRGAVIDAPAARRRPALLVGLALVLLAGQPAVLGAQVFSSGFVLRGLCLALLSALALLAAWQATSTRPQLGRLGTALLLLPVGVAILGLPAFDGTWAGAARAGAAWVLPSALALALLWTWQGPRDAAAAFRVLSAAGAVAALFVLADRLAGHPAVGPFGRTGIAGPVLGALIGPALLLPWRRRVLGRLVLCLPLILGCVATGSRTAVVAAAFGVVGAYAAGAPTAPARRRARIALAMAAVLAVCALGLIVERVMPIPGPSSTVDVRLGLHRASLDAIAEAPLGGHGLGGFSATALRHRDLAEARLEPGRRAYHAHNDYLHAGVEGGWLATLLLMAGLAGLALRALRLPVGAGPGRPVAGAALGVFVTLAVAALGDGVLIDPAPALLLGVAMAAVLSASAPVRVAAGSVAQLPVVGGALLALLVAFVLAGDAIADRDLMRYRHAISGHPHLAARTLAAADAIEPYLERGVLGWRPQHAEALYRRGAYQASVKKFDAARESFRAAIQADPGMTEARLDLAQVYELEGRSEDARATLEEAQRHDPTRYAIPRRLGNLLLGPEPVPGDPAPTFDDIALLRRLNDARALAPDRFENLVDDARIERRRARDNDGLAMAGAKLRVALSAAPGGPAQPPAEILLESFHLAETEGGVPLIYCSTILMQALAKNPAPALRYRAQADRFLQEGVRRAEAARQRAGQDPSLLDMRSAQRAFDAAAVRYTALLYVGLEAPEAVLARARAAKSAGEWRHALALYRSLLAWTLPPKERADGEGLRGDQRLEAIARQGDLLIEASQVAQRVDRPLASFYRIQGQLRLGVELLAKGKYDMARLKLMSAVDADPDLADGHFALARVLANLTHESEAEQHLLEALRLKPSLKRRALAAPDLQTIRRRNAVKLRLGIP